MDGGLNAQRLQEVKLLLELGVVDLSLEARMHAFKHSIVSALAFPNFGLILTSNDRNILLSLGQHSFFLDTFALYGIWVGCLQAFVFLTPLVRLLSDKTKANLTLSFSMLVLSLFFFIVNNVTPSIGFAIFFVYPVLNYYLMKQARHTTYVKNYCNRYRNINA